PTSFSPTPRPRCLPLFPYTTLFRSWWAYHVKSFAFGVHLQTIYSTWDSTLAKIGESLYASDKYFKGAQLDLKREPTQDRHQLAEDRKSTRLNSSHEWISYAVSCLKK